MSSPLVIDLSLLNMNILTLHLSRDNPPHRLAWCRAEGMLPWVLYFLKSRGDIAIRQHVFRPLRPRGRKFSGCALKAQNWYNFRLPFRVKCEMQPCTLNCKHSWDTCRFMSAVLSIDALMYWSYFRANRWMKIAQILSILTTSANFMLVILYGCTGNVFGSNSGLLTLITSRPDSGLKLLIKLDKETD